VIWGFEGYVGRKWGETTAPLKEQRGSPLSEGIYVANDNDDQPVLSHIDRLVKEEEHLYGKSELTEEDRRRLADLLSRSMGHRMGRTFVPRCQYCALHGIHDILNAALGLGMGSGSPAPDAKIHLNILTSPGSMRRNNTAVAQLKLPKNSSK